MAKKKPSPRKAATKKPARPKQPHLTGLEPVSYPDLDAAAGAYVDARDERMEQTKVEVDTRDGLINVMRAHKLTTYRVEASDGPLLVTLTDEAKVTVRKPKDPKATSEADGA